MTGPEWWTYMKRLAFGPLSLKWDEFWRLCPAQILEMAEAVFWWEGEKYQPFEDLILAHACIVVNNKDARRPRLTPDKLRGGKKKQKETRKKTKAEAMKELEGIRKRMGISKEGR